jgi:allantoin racemase
MIIGCYSDPGLAAAREVADVLVVVPAEASLLFALAIGRKPAIVTTLRSTIPSMEDLVQRLALRDRVACVRAVDVPVLDLRREGARVRDELNREARLAQEAGADSIIPGCMTLAFMDLEEDYGREWDLPLVNPVRAAVWLAFGLWSGGFRHSRVAFSTPRKLQEIIG